MTNYDDFTISLRHTIDRSIACTEPRVENYCETLGVSGPFNTQARGPFHPEL